MTTCNLTAQILRDNLQYDPETGIFVRKVASGTAKIGDMAGWVEPNGYIKLSLFSRKYYAHRCAFLYITGSWPKLDVDHIDGNKANNAFANLRDVSTRVNMQNLKRAKSNSATGLLGVSFNASAGKFMSECVDDEGVKHYLGLFNSPELAHARYLEAKRTLQSGCTL